MYRQIPRNKRWSILIIASFCIAVIGSIGSLAGVLLGLLMLFLGSAFGLVAFTLGPLISSAVSCRRELLADASGAELTRYPDGLVRALEEIAARGTPLRVANAEVSGLSHYGRWGASSEEVTDSASMRDASGLRGCAAAGSRWCGRFVPPRWRPTKRHPAPMVFLARRRHRSTDVPGWGV